MSSPYDEKEEDEDEEGLEEDEEGGNKVEVDPETYPDGPKTIIVGEWSTVKEINAALELAGENDSIFCHGGQYDEEVKMDKPSITLTGPPDMSAEIMKGINSTSNFCKIAKLSVKGGINVRCGNVDISECDIKDAYNGIQIFKTANPTIKQCTTHDIEKCHISVFPGGNGVITNNQFTGDGRRGTVGLYADDADTTVFTENQITNVMTGVYTSNGCKGVQVHNNKIADITAHGIYADLQSKPNVKNNEIKNVAHYGIMIAGGSTGLFRDNIVHSSMRIQKACRPSLFGNWVVIPGTIVNDDSLYALRGVVLKRPEDLPKPKKEVKEEEEEEAE